MLEQNQKTTKSTTNTGRHSALTPEERERIRTYDMWGGGTLGKSLGYGSFGRVFELKNTDGTVDAVKLVTIQYDEQQAEKHASKEAYLLDGLRAALDEIRKMMEFCELKNFVSIYGYETYPIRVNGQLDGYDILIRMEKLQPLRAYIKQKKTEQMYDEALLLQLGIDICTALTEATRLVSQKSHRKMEFIHRDIKPGNIFVSSDGVYKLGDLGTAAMSDHTVYTNIGTPTYMAPEMFKRSGYHANVDLFALGKTLEKLSEGMSLHSGLQKVIDHAEDYPAEQRYQTAQEMRADLEICLQRLQNPDAGTNATLLAEQLTQPTPEYTLKYKEPAEQQVSVPAVRKKKKKWLWLAIFPIAAILAVGGYFGYQSWQTQQKAAQEAMQMQNDIAALQNEITEYMTKKDYLTAISRLDEQNELVAQSSDLQQMQESCKQAYRTEILQQAAEAYHDEDNIAAMDIIAQGLNVMPDDAELTEWNGKYADCDAVNLLDLAVQETNLDKNELMLRQEITDHAGEKYDEYLQISGSVGLFDVNKTAGYCTYPLNEKYEYLQFSYFIQQAGTDYSDVTFKVFADDVCIYDSDTVNASNETTYVDLDVSGCSVLKLECIVNNRIFWNKPSAVIVQPVLKKSCS